MRALSECEAAVSDPLALEVTRSTRHVADSKAYLTFLILGNHLPAALGCVQSVQNLAHGSTQQRCSQLSDNLRYTPLCQQRSLCVQFCSHSNYTNHYISSPILLVISPNSQASFMSLYA